VALGAALGWLFRGSLSSLVGHHQQSRVQRVRAQLAVRGRALRGVYRQMWVT
jgi:hypothetical protein